jgi:hypothetical protein
MAKEKSSVKSGMKTLEDIGLREVSRKTYIELNYLKLMAAKDFSKLQRIKTLGFVKILQREYGVDMSEWVAEFETYLKDSGKIANDKVKEIDKVLTEHKTMNKQRKIYIILGVVFLLFFTAFIYNFIKGRAGHIEYTMTHSNITYADDDNAATSVIYTTNETIGTVDEQTSKNEDASAVLSVQEENVSAREPVRQQPVVVASNAAISPNIELWVGIVDLNTFKKRVYLQESDINLDTSKEQIAITGHGDFTLKTKDNADKSFNPQNKIYLHIKDGSVKEISAEEFTELNKGRLW